MVRPLKYRGENIYICEVCEFGYVERRTAEECEAFCTKNNACSVEITKNAVYRSGT